jgi:hypothetical protein
MDHIKRAVLQELRFTFKDCDDNLDLILKTENREEVMTREQLEAMLDDVLDEVANMMTEHIYDYIDEYTLEFMSEVIDSSF